MGLGSLRKWHWALAVPKNIKESGFKK